MRVPGYVRPLAGALLLFLSFLPSARAQDRVDVALVIAVDVSRSMSYEELRIQRKGYAAAIASPEVVRAIQDGVYGRIAVTLYEWAADSYVHEIIGWTLIENQADAEAIAALLLSENSVGARRTSLSGAIRAGVERLEQVPFSADRLVIDISGDGPNNQGLPVTEERDKAVAKGIIINGLPLMTSSGMGSWFNIPDLDVYYHRCVTGGPGSFVIPVTEWEEFPEAVRRKLVLEIGGVEMPKPRVMPAQLFKEEPYDCLIGEKIWQQRMWQYDDFDR
ncbi:DUF1194 domain-containing protein [uncultured Roseibium sp.]|uniref:DUF1194 domain-containing protein n=1 Tax=uncultured Roseibium sp. TaxID=1936171 RepID=UPI003216BEF1